MSSYTVQGSYTGAVSAKQIVLEQYETKVMRSLCTAFKTHSHEVKQLIQTQMAALKLQISRDTRICNADILYSTGDLKTDRFILQVVNEAFKNFPPLPPMIHGDFYDFPVIQFPHVQAFLGPAHQWVRQGRN